MLILMCLGVYDWTVISFSYVGFMMCLGVVLGVTCDSQLSSSDAIMERN